MKPLLVGEANPYGGDPAFALYPHPERASGHRLATLVMGLEPREYVRRFDRQNLCPEDWSVPVARATAQAIAAGPREIVVLLGAKVTKSFLFDYEPFTVRKKNFFKSGEDEWRVTAVKTFVILPHPSGLCRLWNEPGAFERARSVLVESGAL